ncbi:MAG: histidine kinase [Opitutaceae bacterium]|nr:histidine kinase [Opitutaceae bacterium]
MSAPPSHLPLHRLYAFGQFAGWGSFLLLRLFLTATYVAKTAPGASIVDACVFEAFSHFAGAAWSHVVWSWLTRRRLIERGWRRFVGEGQIVANLGTVLLVLLAWPFYPTIYAADFERFGAVAMIWLAIGQNTMITALWFWSFVALLYFDRTRRLELERAEAHASAREAQLHALRGQVNPHFLFNSFNSLRALIALDPARATEALTQLSTLLRYSLSGTDRLVVPLAEELHIVRLYLELESLRLGTRLRVTPRLPESTNGAVLPPMLLQGLVENAVKFGPAALKAGGELAYRVELANDRLHLRVTNPGRLTAKSDSTALGLHNLRARLSLLYGDAATFSLREEPGELVVAEASFPARLPESSARATRSEE